MIPWPKILKHIEQKTRWRLDAHSLGTVSGGCINSAFIVGTDEQRVFIKTNQSHLLPMFETEAMGLAEIAQYQCIQTPKVICTGTEEGTAYIALHAIDLSKANNNNHRKFGQQLAQLHLQHAEQYGADFDNYIGSSVQVNTRSTNWFDFWREQRLGVQLELLIQKSAPTKIIDAGFLLGSEMETFFDAMPSASCLHGDLWQGNWGFDQTGAPIIFDPAHYYGDREADIAMTKLFGAAPDDFYAAYEEIYPLSEHYPSHETFYNLYHILNHYHLFGGGYLEQAHHMIQSLLSETR
ncbi:MAG: fructosamine kinase family protein [Arenicellales bacterium]